MDIKRLLGRRIRELREAAGLAQDELANLAGLSRVAVGAIERGAMAPKIDTLEKLSAALDISLPELVNVERRAAPPRPDRPATRVLSLMRRASREDVARFERLAFAYFTPDRKSR